MLCSPYIFCNIYIHGRKPGAHSRLDQARETGLIPNPAYKLLIEQPATSLYRHSLRNNPTILLPFESQPQLQIQPLPSQ